MKNSKMFSVPLTLCTCDPFWIHINSVKS
uniref:Uncharacterized protein n=1 Tax=Anguilla anguilla TaxID=7936 RepID=A0A0E9SA42_ANGAN